jgi:hypothetical protein
MARNDHRRFSFEAPDRAQLRAGADSWRSLANVAVASTLVVAVVVSVLALLESVFSTSASKLARRSPAPPESLNWHARQRTDRFSTAPSQGEPALLVSD